MMTEIPEQSPRPAKSMSSRHGDQQIQQDVGYIGEHQYSIKELCERLNTHPEQGLTQEQYVMNMRIYGDNTLSKPSATPEWVKFCRHLFGGFSLMLWIASMLCFIAFIIQANTFEDVPYGNLYFALVLIVLVLVSGIFSYILERTGTSVMKSFRRMAPKQAVVIRNGVKQTVLASNLAPGDVVEVRQGETIPADLRITFAQNFKVDISALTGDSRPQRRGTELLDPFANPLYASNMAYFSTDAVEGLCRGVVVFTGDSTVMGRIANLASTLEQDDSPVKDEVELFMMVIGTVALVAGFIIFMVQFLYNNYYWLDSMIFFIGVTLGSVPLSLMVIVAVCLFAAAKRIELKGFLIKNISCLATVGSINVICADKTGTLTENMMNVSQIWLGGHLFHQEDSVGYERDPAWPELQRVAIVANHGQFDVDEEIDVPVTEKKMWGDALDTALLRFMEMYLRGHSRLRSGAGLNDTETTMYKKQFGIHAEIPFSTTTRLHASFVQSGTDTFGVLMKGGPEFILQRCSTALIGGKEVPLSPELRQHIEYGYHLMCEGGEVVLGFADSWDVHPSLVVTGDEKALVDLRFVGLVSFIDPPRGGIDTAIHQCRSAGIKVMMITGDHPVTAKAVAKSVGILTGKTIEDVAKDRQLPFGEIHPNDSAINACVLTGADLQYLDDITNALQRYEELIFARIGPEQKLQIVECCQRRGDIVAVTGDGVNDAAALKKADIGFAMGLNCSDVCKEASDILVTENFSSLPVVLEEGRLVYDNMKKCIRFIMTSNIPEALPFFVFLLLDIPLPFGAIAILLVDLITDMLPALSLAFEKPEFGRLGTEAAQYSKPEGDVSLFPQKYYKEELMKKDPFNPEKDRIVSSQLLNVAYGQTGMIEFVAGMFTYFIIMAECGFLPLRLIGIRNEWDGSGVNDLEDSYGQQWTFGQRKTLESLCHSAFFGTVCLMQCVNAILSRTRWSSVFYINFRNLFFNIATPISFVIAILLIYIPGLNGIVGLSPIKFWWWLPCLPFLLGMTVFDALRGVMIRFAMSSERSPTFLPGFIKPITDFVYQTTLY